MLDHLHIRKMTDTGHQQTSMKWLSEELLRKIARHTRKRAATRCSGEPRVFEHLLKMFAI